MTGKKSEGAKHELIGLRLSEQMKRMLEEATRKNMHLSVQELIRSAIREHMRQNYPQLFEKYRKKVR